MHIAKEQEDALEDALDKMAIAKKALRAAKGTADEPAARRNLLAELTNVYAVIALITEFNNNLNSN